MQPGSRKASSRRSRSSYAVKVSPPASPSKSHVPAVVAHPPASISARGVGATLTPRGGEGLGVARSATPRSAPQSPYVESLKKTPDPGRQARSKAGPPEGAKVRTGLDIALHSFRSLRNPAEFITHQTDKKLDLPDDLAWFQGVPVYEIKPPTQEEVLSRESAALRAVGLGAAGALGRARDALKSKADSEKDLTLSPFRDFLLEQWPDKEVAWNIIASSSLGTVTMNKWKTNARQLRYTGNLVVVFNNLQENGELSKADFMKFYKDQTAAEPPKKGGGKGEQRAAAKSPAPTALKVAPRDQFLNPMLVDQFGSWVSQNCCWDALMSMFDSSATTVVDNSTNESLTNLHDRQPLRAEDFIRACKHRGFKGNARGIFEEIQHLDGKPLQAETLSLLQLKRFHEQVTTLTCVPHFVAFLARRRGAVLRAWRMDLDRRGLGRISYNDFGRGCRLLGIHGAKHLWRGFRAPARLKATAREVARGAHADDDPETAQQRPLSFWEVCRHEAENVDQFLELVRFDLGLALERTWQAIKAHGGDRVTLEAFQQSCDKLDFKGDAELLFMGLVDKDGEHFLDKDAFFYLPLVSTTARPARGNLTRGAPFQDLAAWVECRPGGPRRLLADLALDGGPVPVPVLANRLTTLGYPGDALRVAAVAAQVDGGLIVTSRGLLPMIKGLWSSGDPAKPSGEGKLNAAQTQDFGPPKAAASTRSGRSATPSTPRGRSPPPPGTSSLGLIGPRDKWQLDATDISSHNELRCPSNRDYFTRPDSSVRVPGADASPRHRSLGLRKSLSTMVVTSESLRHLARPAWNETLDTTANVNDRLPKTSRQYFVNEATLRRPVPLMALPAPTRAASASSREASPSPTPSFAATSPRDAAREEWTQNLRDLASRMREVWPTPKQAWKSLDSFHDGWVTYSEWMSNSRHLKYPGDLSACFHELASRASGQDGVLDRASLVQLYAIEA